MPNFDQDKVDKIRKLTIISMFAASDDLMELFALKGGNALNYIYHLNQRSSIDIDISMENSFEDMDLKLEEVESVLKNSFERTFKENNLMAFDIKLEKKPQKMDSDKEGFWGGYQLSFKVLSLNKWLELKENEATTTDDMSRQAIPFNREFKRKFTVDISRYEYVKNRELKL
ncbi:MAG: nucleotidyl transferase AbiEii/AbiGii toxin family protein, partial [Nanoarchaeota archaeon]